MRPADTCEVAIVGGGPAGIAAALVASAYGIDACLVDEQPRLGGQIYRQPPVGFAVDDWLTGKIYRRGRALLQRAEGLAGLRHLSQATVWGVFPSEPAATDDRGHHVLFERNGEPGRLKARHVLLATGCYEMPVPFPGWHLPGVMSAGAIQTLLKSQRIAAGLDIVLAGSHPLLLVAADQLLQAGARVTAVVFTQSMRDMARALRSPAPLLGASGQLLHAAGCLRRIVRARVPLLFGQVVAEAVGSAAVQAVRVCRSDFRGASRLIECDTVGVCYGFLVSSELARQAGVQSNWEAAGGWVVKTDAFLRTSVPRLSVAGELIGVAGAEAAALSGEIAGLGIARDLGQLSPSEASLRSRAPRRRLERAQRFAAVLNELARPAPPLLRRLATPATILCRCEEVTVAALGAVLRADPAVDSASAAKLLTRVGMGMCQGRMCEIAVRRLIGEHHGRALADIAGYAPRVPVKPIPLAALAAQAAGTPLDPRGRVA